MKTGHGCPSGTGCCFYTRYISFHRLCQWAGCSIKNESGPIIGLAVLYFVYIFIITVILIIGNFIFYP